MKNRPPASTLWVWGLALFLISMTGPRLATAASVRLELSQPVRVADRVVIDVGLHDMFDADLRATLRSGLPVSLVFKWAVWQERQGRRDRQVRTGSIRFRIYFDVLEEDYNIFNEQGRPLASCEALTGVQGVVCDQEKLVLGAADDFSADHSYHVWLEVVVEALSDHQVHSIESWLLDQADDADGSLTRDLPAAILGLIKNLAGIRDRNTSARSPSFRGWK